MRTTQRYVIRVLIFTLAIFTAHTFAQEEPPATRVDKKTDAATQQTAAEIKANSAPKTDVREPTSKSQPAKKMVQDATINLQTTITGNQEQPRVLYILPWQSPQTADVDFEPLENEQKSVFGHVEREELLRELDVAGEAQ